MSSFKRKVPGKQANTYPGTRVSPTSLSTVITSTGIPSLDDILGGGLPLSCSLLIAAPDLHSSYGELVQKYCIAQGLKCGHNLCVIDDKGLDFVKEIMWAPGSKTFAADETADGEDDEKISAQQDQKINIAWRYEQMKQFQTTVTVPSSSAEEFCHTFDLTSRVPGSVIEDALRSGQLTSIAIQSLDLGRSSTVQILGRVAQVLKPENGGPTSSIPLRICIPLFGSPQWGELTSQDILYFLHSLRSLLRRHPHACASLSLAPHLSTESWGGAGWLHKLAWLSDAALTLAAFTANPSLSAIFPSHHGLVHVHTLPAPHTLLPPSDKFSILRGLSPSVAPAGGSGENNLAFKCTRKRLIFETLHLDVEGGVGERRTSSSAHSLATESAAIHDPGGRQMQQEYQMGKTAFAAVQVTLEQDKPGFDGVIDEGVKATDVLYEESKKHKKKVAFQSNRPDLYDF